MARTYEEINELVQCGHACRAMLCVASLDLREASDRPPCLLQTDPDHPDREAYKRANLHRGTHSLRALLHSLSNRRRRNWRDSHDLANLDAALDDAREAATLFFHLLKKSSEFWDNNGELRQGLQRDEFWETAGALSGYFHGTLEIAAWEIGRRLADAENAEICKVALSLVRFETATAVAQEADRAVRADGRVSRKEGKLLWMTKAYDLLEKDPTLLDADIARAIKRSKSLLSKSNTWKLESRRIRAAASSSPRVSGSFNSKTRELVAIQH